MRAAGQGRILITGSLAGMIPGSYQAVYNATKAYLDTLSWGVREELRDSGVTVTCLMPGPVDTEFFERAHMETTPVGQDPSKADPAEVAQAGYDAMKRGVSGVSPGFATKMQSALSGVVPDEILARMHRQMAEPEEYRNG
jgi:short-subunit dehydrogenase